MSSSDSQPPLTRRQARERERAAETGAVPVAPPASVSETVPASAATDTGASGQDAASRRPGSHAAPVIASAAPVIASAAQPSGRRAAPASARTSVEESAPTLDADVPDTRPTAVPEQTTQAGPALPSADAHGVPASALEVPGTGMTRRELRALRDAQQHQQSNPVPLQAPGPQSSDRTVADVLGSVAAIEHDRGVIEAVESAPIEPAQLEQATVADGSPDAIEPLAEAAAHAEEPRVHRSTWAPSSAQDEDDAPDEPSAPVVAGVPAADPLGRAARGVPPATTPTVFPIDLDEDAPEDDVDDRVPAAADDRSAADAAAGPADGDDGIAREGRGASATPVPDEDGRGGTDTSSSGETAAAPTARFAPPTVPYEPPVGHWSRQADEPDDQLHDPETGVVRITDSSANSIIMPNSALSDVTGALNATGEVIITGSIDLPKTLAATGAHTPHIDGVEVDRLLEQHDAEAPASDATPVRASRAVSSHTSTRAVVLAASRPKESRLPLALSVGAATVGVAGVAAIVIAAFALHLV